jgi:hypothetical protein
MECRHWDGNPENNNDWNLVYGTRKENAEDRDRHGRTGYGQRNGNARLTDANAIAIKELYAAGLANQYELAEQFSISQAQVNNIVLGKQRISRRRVNG